MDGWLLLIATFVLIGALLIGFLVIARKGRILRTTAPLPPVAQTASFSWVQDGKKQEINVICPFYLGKSPECNIVLPKSGTHFEVCIFYHTNRFAIQSLDRAGTIFVNGQEMIAGYLSDGDTVKIADQEFVFRCF